MALHTAHSLGVDRLYHYQPYDAERLARIVLQRELYFSNPKDFNDPWDCRPWYDSRPADDPAFREKHAEWYLEITRRNLPDVGTDEMARRADHIRRNPQWLRDKIAESSAGIQTDIEKRYRVYCMGTRPDCELMWAHYAQKHNGLCLEFVARRTLFSAAMKVFYLTDYPVMDLTDDTEERNLLPLLAKSAAWSYEDEYRLIAQERAAANAEGTLYADNGIVRLPEGILTGIIAGCMASESALHEIRELVAKSGQALTLKRAVRENDRYLLSIAPVQD